MNLALLKKALISEKSFQMAGEGKFSFIVDKSSNKEQVSLAIKELFSVDVIAVNIANYKGKVKRGKKGIGKRSDYKKAVVTLKKGQKIALFEAEKADAKEKSANKNDKKEIARKESGKSADTTVQVRTRKVI